MAIIAVVAVYVVFRGDPLDESQATTPSAHGHLLVILLVAIGCSVVAHFAVRDSCSPPLNEKRLFESGAFNHSATLQPRGGH